MSHPGVEDKTTVLMTTTRRLQKLIVSVLLLLCSIVTTSPLLSQSKTCPAGETGVTDTKFKPGQVWTYTTRPNETSSTLTILQIDRLEIIGVVIHIRLDGLDVYNPRGEVIHSIGHMPFTRDAILTSTSHLARTNAHIPSMGGYQRWRQDCGGVYSIPVRAAVDVMEITLNQGRPIKK